MTVKLLWEPVKPRLTQYEHSDLALLCLMVACWSKMIVRLFQHIQCSSVILPYTKVNLVLQLIMLLSAMGIADQVFEQKQAEWFQQIRTMTTDPRVGLKFLMTADKVGALSSLERVLRLVKSGTCNSAEVAYSPMHKVLLACQMISAASACYQCLSVPI